MSCMARGSSGGGRVEGRSAAGCPEHRARAPGAPAVAVPLAFAVALGGCAPRAQDVEDCWWLGSLNPLTGGLGPVGLPLENAAKLAVQDVNRAGPVAGKALCIATGDDRTDPVRAARVAQALFDTHGIRGLNGAAASSASLEVATVAEQHSLAMISCCSTSPALTQLPHVFRTVPSDALQGVALANYAKAVAGASRVAIIYLDNTYGSALMAEFERAFVGDDRVISAKVPYAERQSSYAREVTMALSGTPPDHVVLIAYPVEGIQIIRDWRTSGVGRDVKWLATDGLKDDSFALAVGEDVPGLAGTAPLPNGLHYSEFEARYMAAYGGEPPGIFTSNQYDAVILLALGMAAAGPDATRGQVRDVIPGLSRPGGTVVSIETLERALELAAMGADIDYEGVSGPVDLDDNGDVLSGYRVWHISPELQSLEDTSLCFRCDQDPAKVIACIAQSC